MSDATCLRLRIHGRVQGVGFRESMRLEAERLKVAGWVRNCRDGTVEAVVEGPAESVEAMLRWARRGPDLAHVVRVEAQPDDGGYADFDTRPTA